MTSTRGVRPDEDAGTERPLLDILGTGYRFAVQFIADKHGVPPRVVQRTAHYHREAVNLALSTVGADPHFVEALRATWTYNTCRAPGCQRNVEGRAAYCGAACRQRAYRERQRRGRGDGAV